MKKLITTVFVLKGIMLMKPQNNAKNAMIIVQSVNTLLIIV